MKPAEIRELSIEEMRTKDAELTKELFNLRLRHAANQLENPLKLRILRKDVARLKTIIAEKEGGKK